MPQLVQRRLLLAQNGTHGIDFGKSQGVAARRAVQNLEALYRVAADDGTQFETAATPLDASHRHDYLRKAGAILVLCKASADSNIDCLCSVILRIVLISRRC